MGRHSAPETDEERPEPDGPVPSAQTVVWTQPIPPPQPAPSTRPVAATQRVAPTQPVPSEADTAVAEQEVAGPAETPPATRAPKPTPATGTRGDLQLLRSDTRLLLWCAGSVVLLFLVYTSVLILIGRTDVYLIWLWVPTVLSGMAIGGLLDRAHRRLSDRDRPAP
jgi:hypothetical protein